MMTDFRGEDLRERVNRLEASNRRWLLAYVTTLVIATGFVVLTAAAALLVPSLLGQRGERPSPPPQPAAEGRGAAPPYYANFCRVTCTPEEVVLDLDFIQDAFAKPASGPGKDSRKVTMTHYTAKRILTALQLTLKRHEDTYGVIETDVKQRARAGGKQP
jgi:hypothetical protein